MARLPPERTRRIRAALDAIATDPLIGKDLRDELAGFRSLRIGRLRIVYRNIDSVVSVIAVGRRETVYEEVARRIVAAPKEEP